MTLAAGGILTSLSDCAKIGYLFIDSKGILTNESLDETTRSKGKSFIPGVAENFGLGWHSKNFAFGAYDFGVYAVMAGGGTQEQFDAAGQYAGALGLAFQARDDILDCISTKEELGKPIGSDFENKKTTLASLLGIEECEKLCAKMTAGAIDALEGNFENTAFLKSLALHLADRKN
jgi:hypothetical protein